MRSVEVHNNQGKVICKIEAPFTWKDVLLSVSVEWKNPMAVVRWAWETAQQVPIWEAENHQPDIREGTFQYEYGALCQACLKYSVLPDVTKHNRTIVGYSCITEGCPMRQVRIPKVLVEKINEKPLGLAFTPLLMAFKEKYDKDRNALDSLISAAVTWLSAGLLEKEKPPLVSKIDGSVDIDQDKITQQGVNLEKRLTELTKADLCTKCEKPIIGTLKNKTEEMNVCFSDYVYLSIHSKTGLCISCIDEFLESILAILKKQEQPGQD